MVDWTEPEPCEEHEGGKLYPKSCAACAVMVEFDRAVDDAINRGREAERDDDDPEW